MRAPKGLWRAAGLVTVGASVSATLPGKAGAEPPPEAPPEAAAAEVAVPPMSPYVDGGMMLDPAQAYGLLTLSLSTRPVGQSSLDVSLGGGVGITPRIALDASLGTISVTDETRYHSPQAGVTVGLLDTPPAEVDLMAHVTFATDGKRFAEQLEPGALGIFRFSHEARLDAGLYAPVTPGSPTTLGLRVPLTLALQLTPFLHASVGSGVTVGDLRNAGGSTSIPLSLGVGVKARAGRYTAFVAPSVTWPKLFEPGNPSPDRPRALTLGAVVAVITP